MSSVVHVSQPTSVGSSLQTSAGADSCDAIANVLYVVMLAHLGTAAQCRTERSRRAQVAVEAMPHAPGTAARSPPSVRTTANGAASVPPTHPRSEARLGFKLVQRLYHRCTFVLLMDMRQGATQQPSLQLHTHISQHGLVSPSALAAVQPHQPALRSRQDSAGAYRIFATRRTGRLAAKALQTAGVEQDAAVFYRHHQCSETCSRRQAQVQC